MSDSRERRESGLDAINLPAKRRANGLVQGSCCITERGTAQMRSADLVGSAEMRATGSPQRIPCRETTEAGECHQCTADQVVTGWGKPRTKTDHSDNLGIVARSASLPAKAGLDQSL